MNAAQVQTRLQKKRKLEESLEEVAAKFIKLDDAAVGIEQAAVDIEAVEVVDEDEESGPEEEEAPVVIKFFNESSWSVADSDIEERESISESEQSGTLEDAEFMLQDPVVPENHVGFWSVLGFVKGIVFG